MSVPLWRVTYQCNSQTQEMITIEDREYRTYRPVIRLTDNSSATRPCRLAAEFNQHMLTANGQPDPLY